MRRAEDGCLALEPVDAAVNVGNPEQDRSVVDEIARSEVVGPVDDQIVAARNIEGVAGGESGLVRLDVHVGVDVTQPVASGIDLRAADPRGAVEYLTLQVRKVDHIEVDQAKSADAGGGEIESNR